MRDNHQIQPPGTGPNGAPIPGKPLTVAPNQTTIVNKTVNNTTVINNIVQTNNYYQTDIYRNRYYWHDYSGVQYCHYYDNWGYHWYGWYIGDSYYWTRYYNNYFWWNDPYYHRWSYWRNGYWWWQDPDDVTVVYVYVNNNYYRYGDTNNGVVLQPAQPAQPPDPGQPAPTPADPSEKYYYSDDGTRSVQVAGKERRAYLYDRTRTDEDGYDLFLKELAANVAEVEFSDPADGPLQIVLHVVNRQGKKHVVAFDSDGNRLGGAVPPASATDNPQPPADNPQTPTDVPPPPASADGAQSASPEPSAFQAANAGVNAAIGKAGERLGTMGVEEIDELLK